MKAIRTYLLKWYVTAPLALAVVLVSCDSQTESVKPSLAAYSGKELFEGLMFAKGEVASAIPELKREIVTRASISGELLDDIDKVEDNMIKIIEAKNPDYFDNFKASITSGKHILIKRTLSEGEEVMLDAVQTISGYEAYDIAGIHSIADKMSVTFEAEGVIKEDGSIDLVKLKEINKNSLNAENGKQALLFVVLVVLVFWVLAKEAPYELNLKNEQITNSLVEASM